MEKVKTALVVLAIILCLVPNGSLMAQMETVYEVGAVLLPHLNMTYLGRSPNALLLWSQEVPGNYIVVPKSGTNKYTLMWHGGTYILIGATDSTITIRR